MEYVESAAIRGFVAVVQYKGFSAAAKALRIQQPAVSKAVRALEARLGHVLIDRNDMTLTTAGRVAYARALRIIEETALMVEDANASRGELAGELWLSANEHVATYVLPKALAAFKRRHPRVIPRVITGAAHLMVPELVNGRQEFGLFFKVEKSPLLARKAIGKATCQLVVSQAHRGDESALTAFIGSREVDDIANKKFPTLRMLQRKRPETAIAVSCSSLEAHKHLLLAGYGISILPLFVVADELAAGRLVRVMPEYRYAAALECVWRKGKQLSPAAAALLACVAQQWKKTPFATD